MAEFYGRPTDPTSPGVRARGFAQFGGVRLVTCEDGVERGMRLLELRTGSGLCVSVMVDHAMDIADLSHNGRAIVWHSPTGFRHPGLHEPKGEAGLGWARSFSGFLSTCGLDHTLGTDEVDGSNYNDPRRLTLRHGLHARLGAIPARLTGYGERWEGDRCILWAEGVIGQAAVFGEVLYLHRRIKADLASNEVRLTGRVVIAGCALTPHLLTYHINPGYPVIDDGSRSLAPSRRVIWASPATTLMAQDVGYRQCPASVAGFAEQVWEHDMAADATGLVPVAGVNDRVGPGPLVETHPAQFPRALQWQNFHADHNEMGVEPSTHHAQGNRFARDRGDMIWLQAGEMRQYDSRFGVLDRAGASAATASPIAAITRQPDTDYPLPMGHLAALQGAADQTKGPS